MIRGGSSSNHIASRLAVGKWKGSYSQRHFARKRKGKREGRDGSVRGGGGWALRQSPLVSLQTSPVFSTWSGVLWYFGTLPLPKLGIDVAARERGMEGAKGGKEKISTHPYTGQLPTSASPISRTILYAGYLILHTVRHAKEREREEYIESFYRLRQLPMRSPKLVINWQS